MPDPKLRKVCPHCGSDEIRRLAISKWNLSSQQWDVVETYDEDNWCTKCEKSFRHPEDEIETRPQGNAQETSTPKCPPDEDPEMKHSFPKSFDHLMNHIQHVGDMSRREKAIVNDVCTIYIRTLHSIAGDAKLMLRGGPMSAELKAELRYYEAGMWGIQNIPNNPLSILESLYHRTICDNFEYIHGRVNRLLASVQLDHQLHRRLSKAMYPYMDVLVKNGLLKEADKYCLFYPPRIKQQEGV